MHHSKSLGHGRDSKKAGLILGRLPDAVPALEPGLPGAPIVSTQTRTGIRTNSAPHLVAAVRPQLTMFQPRSDNVKQTNDGIARSDTVITKFHGDNGSRAPYSKETEGYHYQLLGSSPNERMVPNEDDSDRSSSDSDDYSQMTQLRGPGNKLSSQLPKRRRLAGIQTSQNQSTDVASHAEKSDGEPRVTYPSTEVRKSQHQNEELFDGNRTSRSLPGSRAERNLNSNAYTTDMGSPVFVRTQNPTDKGAYDPFAGKSGDKTLFRETRWGCKSSLGDVRKTPHPSSGQRGRLEPRTQNLMHADTSREAIPRLTNVGASACKIADSTLDIADGDMCRRQPSTPGLPARSSNSISSGILPDQEGRSQQESSSFVPESELYKPNAYRRVPSAGMVDDITMPERRTSSSPASLLESDGLITNEVGVSAIVVPADQIGHAKATNYIRQTSSSDVAKAAMVRNGFQAQQRLGTPEVPLSAQVASHRAPSIPRHRQSASPRSILRQPRPETNRDVESAVSLTGGDSLPTARGTTVQTEAHVQSNLGSSAPAPSSPASSRSLMSGSIASSDRLDLYDAYLNGRSSSPVSLHDGSALGTSTSAQSTNKQTGGKFQKIFTKAVDLCQTAKQCGLEITNMLASENADLERREGVLENTSHKDKVALTKLTEENKSYKEMVQNLTECFTGVETELRQAILRMSRQHDYNNTRRTELEQCREDNLRLIGELSREKIARGAAEGRLRYLEGMPENLQKQSVVLKRINDQQTFIEEGLLDRASKQHETLESFDKNLGDLERRFATVKAHNTALQKEVDELKAAQVATDTELNMKLQVADNLLNRLGQKNWDANVQTLREEGFFTKIGNLASKTNEKTTGSTGTAMTVQERQNYLMNPTLEGTVGMASTGLEQNRLSVISKEARQGETSSRPIARAFKDLNPGPEQSNAYGQRQNFATGQSNLPGGSSGGSTNDSRLCDLTNANEERVVGEVLNTGNIGRTGHGVSDGANTKPVSEASGTRTDSNSDNSIDLTIDDAADILPSELYPETDRKIPEKDSTNEASSHTQKQTSAPVANSLNTQMSTESPFQAATAMKSPPQTQPTTFTNDELLMSEKAAQIERILQSTALSRRLLDDTFANAPVIAPMDGEGSVLQEGIISLVMNRTSLPRAELFELFGNQDEFEEVRPSIETAPQDGRKDMSGRYKTPVDNVRRSSRSLKTPSEMTPSTQANSGRKRPGDTVLRPQGGRPRKLADNTSLAENNHRIAITDLLGDQPLGGISGMLKPYLQEYFAIWDSDRTAGWRHGDCNTATDCLTSRAKKAKTRRASSTVACQECIKKKQLCVSILDNVNMDIRPLPDDELGRSEDRYDIRYWKRI